MDEHRIQKIECACGCGKKFTPNTGWHIFSETKCKHKFNREMAKLAKQHKLAREGK